MLKLDSLQLDVKNGTEDFTILEDINIELAKGKFYAITGPNGGGKTSLAKVIMGIYKNTQGKVVFDGVDISKYDITQRAKLGISYAFQNPPRFKGMKVKDLLEITDNPQGGPLRARLRAVGLCPKEYMVRECDSSLSGGEMKRIELASVLARRSKVMIYDEPEAGVDLWSFESLLELIRQYHAQGDVTSIIITHHERVLALADEIILVAEGKVQNMGPREEIWPILQEDFRCKWQTDCGRDKDELECY